MNAVKLSDVNRALYEYVMTIREPHYDTEDYTINGDTIFLGPVPSARLINECVRSLMQNNDSLSYKPYYKRGGHSRPLYVINYDVVARHDNSRQVVPLTGYDNPLLKELIVRILTNTEFEVVNQRCLLDF